MDPVSLRGAQGMERVESGGTRRGLYHRPLRGDVRLPPDHLFTVGLVGPGYPMGAREWAPVGDRLWLGALGAMIEMVAGYALVFTGISLLVEGWREVYVATKERRLTTDKLYGVVRHPQYTGIFMAVFGQLIHWPTIPTVVLFPIIVWAYYRLSLREEQQMVRQFGNSYEIYRQNVPMFFPKRGDWKKLISISELSEGEL